MPNTIRIKRRISGAPGSPSSLANAELCFNEVDSILYYGFGTGGENGSATGILAIAGPGAFVTTGTTQTITASKTFSNKVILSGGVSGNTTFEDDLIVTGNLIVNGTTTTVNSTTITVDDKNIELGAIANPTDVGADGGGITLKGTTDKTIRWLDATDAWTSSEHIDLASSKSYYINGAQVLSSTALGSGVITSNLTSVGTINTGVWRGTPVGVSYGGTGASDSTTARANLGLVIGTDVQAYNSNLNVLTGMQSGSPAALALLSPTEIEAINGDTAATPTTLTASDRLVVNDSGTMVQVALSDLITFLENGAVSGLDLDGGTY